MREGQRGSEASGLPFRYRLTDNAKTPRFAAFHPLTVRFNGNYRLAAASPKD
jgi:hypothetical protein